MNRESWAGAIERWFEDVELAELEEGVRARDRGRGRGYQVRDASRAPLTIRVHAGRPGDQIAATSHASGDAEVTNYGTIGTRAGCPTVFEGTIMVLDPDHLVLLRRPWVPTFIPWEAVELIEVVRR